MAHLKIDDQLMQFCNYMGITIFILIMVFHFVKAAARNS
jgi:hypothetical protein